ncbi:MAG: DUF5362 family protein [Chloroflexota bacterium]
MRLAGILILAAAVARLILFALTRADSQSEPITGIIYVLIVALTIVVGVTIWRPADNFKRVVTTKDKDIEELMTGMDELSTGFRLVQYLMGAIVLVVVVGLVLYA